MIQPSLLQQADQDAATRLRSDVLELLLDGQWWTRRELRDELGISDRAIRLIVESSHGVILSGANGYKLTMQATVEEVSEAVARMKKGMDSTGKHIADILRVRASGRAA